MKNVRNCIIGILCPFIIKAQQPVALTIGDKVPDFVFKKITNYKQSFAKLSDFKGKAIILDFWATWCGPCVRGLPKLDSLQRYFSDSIQIIPITQESERTVKSFQSRNKNISLPYVFEDSIVKDYFPFLVLPHAIIINPERIVIGITSSLYLTKELISKALRNNLSELAIKTDVLDFNWNAPLTGEGKFGESSLYRSLLTTRLQGINSRDAQTMVADTVAGFKMVNGTVAGLFLKAFDRPQWYLYSRLYRESLKDGTKYINPRYKDRLKQAAWEDANLYCYEIIAPGLSREQQLKIMRQDISNAFKGRYGLICFLDNRKVKCMRLIRTREDERIITKGGAPNSGYSLQHLDRYQYNNMESGAFAEIFERMVRYPVVNETNMKQNIDFNIPISMVMKIYDTGDLKPLKSLLQEYGLDLVEAEREVEVLVFREEKQ